MSVETIAARMAELGNPTRLSLFKFLVRSGPGGLPVGDIQHALEIPGSTLSHHIARMVKVGLIKQERDSRTLFCIPQFDAVNEVIDFLMAECCVDVSECSLDDIADRHC